MEETSPLYQEALRAIEQCLDAGNTGEASQRLGQLEHSTEHTRAIDFLTTRLLFQRGRIDTDGAIERLQALLEGGASFVEAQHWLEKLRRGGIISSPPPLDDFSLPTEPGISAAEHDEHFPPFHTIDDDLTPPEQPLSLRARDAALARSARPTGAGDSESAVSAQRTDAALLGPRGSDPPVSPTASTRPPPPGVMPPSSRVPTLGAEAPQYQSFDRMNSKSLLPDRAGRYSGLPSRSPLPPPAPVEPNRPRSRPAPRKSAPPPRHSRPAVEAPTALESKPAPRLSRRPRHDTQSSPLQDVRWLVAERDFEHALEALQVAGTSLERDLLKAFVLAKSGRSREAPALLPESGHAGALSSDYRALLVLTLVELGQLDRAHEEARQALDAAPNHPFVRLSFVCSTVRLARHGDDNSIFERAARALAGLDSTVAPEPALLDALHASVEAHVGSPQVAMQLAQRALRADPDSVDALVALAQAASQVGDHHKARAALDTLTQCSPATAEIVNAQLRGKGMSQGPASSASIWLPLENELVGGARESALRGLETQAGKYFRRERHDDLVPMASQTSRFLAAAPVFRHFGPYDMSLSSLERLEIGLGLVYGLGPRAGPEKGAETLPLLAAVYLGETLRQCCQGRWVGDVTRPDDAKVSLAWEDIWPLRLIENRIRHGERAPLRATLSRTLELATPSAHRYRITAPFAPEPPWGEGRLPVADTLPRIGRALSHSVVALFCSEHHRIHLDRSLPSLHAVDKYLELVVGGRPLEKGSRWHNWLSVFIGSYLGEVLCNAFGGAWSFGERPLVEDFIVKLPHRSVAPVLFVMEALLRPEPISLRAWAAPLETSGPFAEH